MSKKIGIGIFSAVSLVLAYLIIRFVLPVIVLICILGYNMITTKPLVINDPGQYQSCFGEKADAEYGVSFDGLFRVFPEEIAKDAVVKEYQYMYYDPFDPQRIAYMTLQYNEEDYAKESERLREIGAEEYIGNYSVTGMPDNYKLLAMYPDPYYGFGYALAPKEEDGSVTYVGIAFCNYFLDVNIHDYLPDAYLLPGFNATADNPYLKRNLRRMQLEEKENQNQK